MNTWDNKGGFNNTSESLKEALWAHKARHIELIQREEVNKHQVRPTLCLYQHLNLFEGDRSP